MKKDASKPKSSGCINAKVERNKNLYVSGTFGEYEFSATVDWEGESKYTVFDSRVSTLNVSYNATIVGKNKSIDIALFNDGWDLVPKSADDYEVVSSILSYLEQLQPEDF